MNAAHLHLMVNHAVAAFALVGRAANLGGRIRHTEISDGAAAGEVDGEAEDREIEH